jgi:hypothetical protein
MLDQIKAGDRVTILVPNGKSLERDANGKATGKVVQDWKQSSGRAVMRGPAGWVLNMGGRYGTPAIASESNIVKVTKRRSK